VIIDHALTPLLTRLLGAVKSEARSSEIGIKIRNRETDAVLTLGRPPVTKVEFQKAQAKGDVPISKIAEYL
jgi:hypothetical protein